MDTQLKIGLVSVSDRASQGVYAYTPSTSLA